MQNIRAILEMHRANATSVHVPEEAIDDIASFVDYANGSFFTDHLTHDVVSAAVQYCKIRNNPPSLGHPRVEQLKIDMWHDELRDRMIEYYEETAA